MLIIYGDRTPPKTAVIPRKGEAPVRVSVVIPVYNGASTIGLLADELIEENPGYALQLVLVNDGSVDGSERVLDAIAGQYPGIVTFINLAKNVGEHNAVMAGLNHARGDFCVIMDDDGQNPPREAFRLVGAAIGKKLDVVFSRYEDKRHHWARNVFSKMANSMAGKLMNLPEGLYLSSFKCLNRFTVDRVVSYTGPFPYIDGLALRATRNIGVLTTQHEPTQKRKSGYTVSKLLKLWVSMTVNFSILPLRAASVLGLLFSLVGAAGAVAVTMEKMTNPALPVGWPSLIVAVLILSGAQLLILGIIGEYLGQLLLTVNGTPQYIVKAVVEKKPRNDED